MRNPFARLAKRDTARPSLRERAALLKASASRVIRREPKSALPAPNSEEARALFRAACTETDRLSHDAVHGYPELKRSDIEWWSCDTLQTALEDGEIAPAEFAQLYRLALERKHRINAAALATDVGSLHVLAFADDFARAASMPAAEAEPDPIVGAIAETRRLQVAVTAASALPQPAGTTAPLPEQTTAMDAAQAHIDGVLLKTVPTTAAGCAALARYAVEFLEEHGFVLDEDQASNEHVRILDLIARSPLLDGAPLGRPPVPDFSGYSFNDLRRTYDAFKMAADIMGLTGWTTSEEGSGDGLLDGEADRLSHFQSYIVAELRRREPADRFDAIARSDTLISHDVACGSYDAAMEAAAEAHTRRLY